MKKLSLLLLAAVFSLSIYSCRETTEEKTEDTLETVEINTEITTETEDEAVIEKDDVNADQE